VFQFADASYRCTECGDCCRGWDVPLLAGEAASFAKLIAPSRLKGALGRAKEIDVISARSGRCAALELDEKCAIHAAHGGEKKPRACRIFPYTFVETPTEVRVGLSFACPAVVDAEGPPLEDQLEEISGVWEGAVKGTRFAMRVPDPTPLDDDLKVPWVQAQVLLDEMAGALDRTGPLLPDVCRAGAILARTIDELSGGLGFGDALEVAREGAAALTAEVLAAPPSVDRLSRAMFRTLLGATEPKAGTVRRLGGVLSSLVGGGSVRLRNQAVEVPLKAVERVRPRLDAAGEALLRRWLGVSLDALTFFGDGAFGLSIAAGLDLLVLQAAVTVFLARAHAHAAGREAPGADDCKRGLRQLDAGLAHRSEMPGGLARALRQAASLDLLREQLGGS
jgi:Fe-S-cluster containining protein